MSNIRREQELEASYLAGTSLRQQSGFTLGPEEWERYRRPVVEAISHDGSFLDVGCANGWLMECVFDWASEKGMELQVHGLDISHALVELARRRLPRWAKQIHVGDAMEWESPMVFDFVRTELVYVPVALRLEYIRRLLGHFVAPGGKLLVCSYGSTRPGGKRAEPLVEPLRAFGLEPTDIHNAVEPEHGFVVTQVAVLHRPGPV